MQKDLLDAHPEASVRVYAVWFDMVPSDSRSSWSPDLLADSRVTHFWDEQKTAGAWFARRSASLEERLTPESEWSGGAVLWDAFLLYGPEARWDEGGPTDLLLFGRTVVAGRDSLAAEIETLFGGARGGSRSSTAPGASP